MLECIVQRSIKCCARFASIRLAGIAQVPHERVRGGVKIDHGTAGKRRLVAEQK